MAGPKGQIGVSRPIRTIPRNIKKLVEELKVEVQSQEINNINQHKEVKRTENLATK